MGVIRTVSCDVCPATYAETDFGLGFPDWSIVDGVAAQELKEGESMTSENMKTHLCPHCTGRVANFITSIQEEEKSSFVKEAK